MTQNDYNIIVKILQIGAPALANELISSLNALIAENTELKHLQNNKKEE